MSLSLKVHSFYYFDIHAFRSLGFFFGTVAFLNVNLHVRFVLKKETVTKPAAGTSSNSEVEAVDKLEISGLSMHDLDKVRGFDLLLTC